MLLLSCCYSIDSIFDLKSVDFYSIVRKRIARTLSSARLNLCVTHSIDNVIFMLFVRLLAICCLITGALTLFNMRNTSINIDSVLYLAQLRACFTYVLAHTIIIMYLK